MHFSLKIWHLTRWFQGPETPSICFLTVSECPSYTAVHRQWSGFPCYCCPYLEQSVPTCHVHTLYVCFPRSTQGFPAFIHMTFTATFIVSVLWKLSFSDTLIVLFYLLIYLLTYLQWTLIAVSLQRTETDEIPVFMKLNYQTSEWMSQMNLYYTVASSIRKLTCRKHDRAMRPIYGCPEYFRESLGVFRESLSAPTDTFAKF